MLRTMLAITAITASGHTHHHHHAIHCHGNLHCILTIARNDCHHNHNDRHHCRIIWRHTHHPQPAATTSTNTTSSSTSSFDQCVAYRESTNNPNAIGAGGLYWGEFQFDQTTWDEATAAMGVTWPWGSASASQQAAVFDYWSQLHPDAWPNSIPACGG